MNKYKCQHGAILLSARGRPLCPNRIVVVVLVHDFVTANIEHIKSVRVKRQQCIVFYVL